MLYNNVLQIEHLSTTKCCTNILSWSVSPSVMQLHCSLSLSLSLTCFAKYCPNLFCVLAICLANMFYVLPACLPNMCRRCQTVTHISTLLAWGLEWQVIGVNTPKNRLVSPSNRLTWGFPPASWGGGGASPQILGWLHWNLVSPEPISLRRLCLAPQILGSRKPHAVWQPLHMFYE